MNQMTLYSRHSSPGGLRPSTLPLCRGGSPRFTRGWRKTYLFLSNRRDREPNPELVKGIGANHYPRAIVSPCLAPVVVSNHFVNIFIIQFNRRSSITIHRFNRIIKITIIGK